MPLSDNEIWANQNPPPQKIDNATTQAQTDVGQGISCGQPINPDGINFELHKLSSCLQNEIKNFVSLSAVPFDDCNPTNLRDAFSNIFCTWLSNFTFQATDTSTNGTVSVTLPPGGTWCYFATLHYIDDDGNLDNTTSPHIQWFNFDTGSNDQIGFGSKSGVIAGGTSITAPTNADNIMMTVKAFRTDCPV